MKDPIINIYIVTEDEVGQRLDYFVCQHEEDYGRNYIKELIKDGNITLNGKPAKASKKVKLSDEIRFVKSPLKVIEAKPQDINIDILYEDEDILVVNKERGMVVHPAPGSLDNTLVNALMFHTKDLSGINGVLRPGIVHRIDKDTSGVLVVAKNDKAHNHLAEQFKDHSINREYIALVEGIIENDAGKINMPLGRDLSDRKKREVKLDNGKNAVTHFRVLKRFKENYTLCKFKLETGRTHQIRVHMKAIGHPIVGDPLYNNRDPFDLNGQLLHARKLGFIHPSTGEYIEFNSEPPKIFTDIVEGLNEK